MGRDEPEPERPAEEPEISIHSPRMGRDAAYADQAKRDGKFQSTLPAWGETVYLDVTAPLYW